VSECRLAFRSDTCKESGTAPATSVRMPSGNWPLRRVRRGLLSSRSRLRRKDCRAHGAAAPGRAHVGRRHRRGPVKNVAPARSRGRGSARGIRDRVCEIHLHARELRLLPFHVHSDLRPNGPLGTQASAPCSARTVLEVPFLMRTSLLYAASACVPAPRHMLHIARLRRRCPLPALPTSAAWHCSGPAFGEHVTSACVITPPTSAPGLRSCLQYQFVVRLLPAVQLECCADRMSHCLVPSWLHGAAHGYPGPPSRPLASTAPSTLQVRGRRPRPRPWPA
jgi:hypothetical protein